MMLLCFALRPFLCNIPCIRRTELEILNVESVWIEIRLTYKRLLIGTFYRPPNSDQFVLSNIERSNDLAIDTGISDIIILGDFYLNMLNWLQVGQFRIYVSSITYNK